MTDPRDPRMIRFRRRVFVAAGVALALSRVTPIARAGGTGGSESSGSGSGSSSGSSSGDASTDESGSEGSSTTEGGASTTADTTSAGEGSTSTSTGDGSTSSEGSTSRGGFGDSTGPGGTDTGPSDIDFDCGGCYGRPYVVDRSVRMASASETLAWSTPARVGGLHDLGATERRALASFWTEAALSEHSSVAGFHRFALDLLAHGAPAELVARAQRAAMQELEHAQACFALAGAYAGRPLGPGSMPLGTSAPIAGSLRELAVWTVHEGCVGETIAAWLAAEIHARCGDPTVRGVMARIAEEEAEHAELAWATIRWAIDVGGAEVRDAVAAAFDVARSSVPTASAVACPEHGLLAPRAMQAAMQRALVEVVRPCARALAVAA